MEDEFETIVTGLDLEEVPELGLAYRYFMKLDGSPAKAVVEVRSYDSTGEPQFGVYTESSEPWGNQPGWERGLRKLNLRIFRRLIDEGFLQLIT